MQAAAGVPGKIAVFEQKSPTEKMCCYLLPGAQAYFSHILASSEHSFSLSYTHLRFIFHSSRCLVQTIFDSFCQTLFVAEVIVIAIPLFTGKFFIVELASTISPRE